MAQSAVHVAPVQDTPKRELDLAQFAATVAEPDEFDRKFCFKLQPRTAAQRTYVFQATSEDDLLAWIQVHARNGSR